MAMMPRTLSLLSFDLREAFDSIPWVVYYWVFFAFEFFVYGRLLSALVVAPTNYIFYYGTGLLVLILFNTASWAGRSFVEGAHEGRLKYLLSLPIGRNQLFFEQIMLGAVVNTVRLIPPLAVIMWLSGDMSILTLLSTLVVLTLLGIAIIGLMVSLSFVAFRSFDIYSAVVAGLSALLISFWTMYYPLAYMPQAYAAVARGEPPHLWDGPAEERAGLPVVSPPGPLLGDGGGDGSGRGDPLCGHVHHLARGRRSEVVVSQLGRVLRIVMVDVSYFFRTKWLIATLIALNLSDMLVLGLVYSGMMDFNYFAFFVPGVVMAGMFAAALDVGRRVYLGLTEGVTQYYLSLPISTEGLVWAHIVSGGLGGTIYSGILLAVALAILPHPNLWAALAMVPILFLLSMGLSGIAAVLNLFSKRGERYWVFADGLQVTFLGLSTISYPLSVIQSTYPALLAQAIQYNPLSQGVGALRSWVFGGQPIQAGAVASLLLTSLILLAMGPFRTGMCSTK